MAKSRPVQGNQIKLRNKRDTPQYKADSAPKVRSRGTLSKPQKLPKPSLSRNVADATPRKVQAPL